MGVEVLMDPVRIEAGDLVSMFLAYCDAYKVKPSVRDVDFMIHQGLRTFHTSGGIDYRPFMGAKFFAQPIGDSYVFTHGYTNDSRQGREYNKFERLLKTYFKEKGVEARKQN